MSAIIKNITAGQKASFETALTLSRLSSESLARLSKLNIETGRLALEESVSGGKAMLTTKGPKELVILQSSMIEPTIAKTLAYMRSVYEIVIQSAEQASSVVEKNAGEINKLVATTLEQAAKAAPAGSEFAVAAVKSAIDATNSAYDSFSKSTRKAVELAEANISAAAKVIPQRISKVA